VVQALATSDSTVYAGGFFTTVAGEPRQYFAALDATTGAIRETYPTPDDYVWSLATYRGTTYVGGAFGRMGSWPQVNFAAVVPAHTPGLVSPQALMLSQSAPNPVRDGAVIRYSLPTNASVSLTAFDLQGRAVSRLLSHAMQPAGQHQLSFSTAGWRPGCYLYRLQAGAQSATRKMIVVK
jgi:hypothetical protein